MQAEIKSLVTSPQGDVSSKRVAGIILIAIGVGWGLWGSLRGTSLMVQYAQWIVGFGAGLIGVGVVEHLKRS